MRRLVGWMAIVTVMGCAGGRTTTSAGPGAAAATGAAADERTASGDGRVRSNVLRRDYAGSAACAECHAKEYDAFMAAPMHNMTRLPGAGVPAAPFRGSFRFKDDAVRFETRGADRIMRIESQQFGARAFLVTKVIGGHYREDFAGVELGGSGAHEERILPVSYFLPTRSWRYKGYSVMAPERPGLRPGSVWNRTCIFCHNTVPYFDDLLGAIAADPKIGPYQGEVVDALLPPARRARWEVTDRAALAAAINDELRVLATPGTTPVTATAGPEELIRALRARFDATKVLELGIGCESCHGGSLEHVRHNAIRPSYAVRASFLRVGLPLADGDDARAAQINRVCARCHQVLFTRYPWTWEGGRRHGAGTPGGSNINSGEARDLLLGGCAGRMACSDCHDPHAHNRPHQDEIEARADGVCVRCHGKYAGAAAQRAHTHHDPAGAGGRCLACHMPRKNMTLDNRLGRYHRVASPTETAKVEGDRPVECALCHGDRSVEWAVGTMEAWWGHSYDRARLRGLYGPDLEHADVLLSTLARGKPHEQAVALARLGARADKRAAPAVAAQLTHPLPILRYYAVAALEAILGGPAPLDVHASNDAIGAAARAWLARSGMPLLAPAIPPSPAPAAPSSDED